MVEQGPTHLFNVGDSGWREHLDSLSENTWLDPQNLPDFGQILHHINSPTNPVYEAVVNKPHYMRALFIAQIKGSVWQDDLLEICKFMNGQPITNSEDKGANKNKSENQQSLGEAEVRTQSPVPKGSMIATNLMGILDAASTIELHSSLVQKSPSRGLIQTADKPQAASANENMEGEFPDGICFAKPADATTKEIVFLFRASH